MSEGNQPKKQRTEEGTCDLTVPAHLECLPSDTEMVIDSIQRTAEKQFGFVFQHQIYATLTNRSIVDEELSSLRHVSKSYKFLQCDFTKSSSGSVFPNATLLIKTDKYSDSIGHFLATNKSLEFSASTDHLLCVKFSHWLETSSQMSMFRYELKNAELFISSDHILSTKKRSRDESTSAEDGKMSRFTLSEAEIDRLIQVGFLHYRNSDAGPHAAASSTRDQELYWLSHPAARSLVRCLQVAEQSIVSQIKKNQYKEMSEKKLKALCDATAGTSKAKKSGPSKALLGDSPFPLSYHLLDLEGRKVLYKVAAPATMDFIWRIQSKA